MHVHHHLLVRLSYGIPRHIQLADQRNRLSSCIKKIDGLEHTPYLDHTCQFLFEAAEYQSDLILVFMARTYIITTSMSRNLCSNLVPASVDIRAPLSMQAKSAKTDLQNHLLALPPDVQEHSQSPFQSRLYLHSFQLTPVFSSLGT